MSGINIFSTRSVGKLYVGRMLFPTLCWPRVGNSSPDAGNSVRIPLLDVFITSPDIFMRRESLISCIVMLDNLFPCTLATILKLSIGNDFNILTTKLKKKKEGILNVRGQLSVHSSNLIFMY